MYIHSLPQKGTPEDEPGRAVAQEAKPLLKLATGGSGAAAGATP